jgi:hypothetical protein
MSAKRSRPIPLGLQYAWSTLDTNGPRGFAAAMLGHKCGQGATVVAISPKEEPDEVICIALKLPDGRYLTPEGLFESTYLGRFIGAGDGKRIEQELPGIVPDVSAEGDAARRLVDILGWNREPYVPDGHGASVRGHWQAAEEDFWCRGGGGMPIGYLIETFIERLERGASVAVAAVSEEFQDLVDVGGEDPDRDVESLPNADDANPERSESHFEACV